MLMLIAAELRSGVIKRVIICGGQPSGQLLADVLKACRPFVASRGRWAAERS